MQFDRLTIPVQDYLQTVRQMRLLLANLIFVLVLVGQPFLASGQERTWKDATGDYTVQAELLEVVDGKAVLKKANGKTIRVPLKVLSEADQAFIRNMNKPKADPITAPKNKPPAKSEPPMKNTESPKTTQPDSTTNTDPANRPSSPASTTSNPTKPVVVAKTKEFIQLDPTHFDSTDIPPRPNPAPVRPDPVASKPPMNADNASAANNTVPTTTTNPPTATPTTTEPAETPTSTSDAAEKVASKEYEIVIPKQTDAVELEPPTVEIAASEVNSLTGDYLSIGKTLYAGEDAREIRNALDLLGNRWPTPTNETLLKLVQKSTNCEEKFCRLKAMNLLGKHDVTGSLPFIMARVDDNSFDIRWAALELISQNRDPRALQPLIDRFTGQDRAKISSVLMEYGSAAEIPLHQFLSHGRAEIRMETALLLGKLGTESSVPKLEESATSDQNAIVSLQAKSAIRNIKKRLELD